MKKSLFLMTLFSLMIVAGDNALAQKACSKDLDGREINLEIINATGRPFTINWVDQNCKEMPSDQQVGPNQKFTGRTYNGHAFRVREVGTNKLLQEFVANPATRAITISAPSPNSNPAQPSGAQPPSAAVATKFPIPAGSTLKRGMKYPSPSGSHFLIFANDGNLVVATKDEGYVWGLDQLSKNFPRSERVEVSKEGRLVVYGAGNNVIWASTGNPDPRATLNFTFNGALQLVSANRNILWSSDGNLTAPINVFLTKANVKPCAPDPGWAKCVEMPDPSIKIMGTAAATQSALNGVANVYTEMTKRFASNYPKSKFNGFKVYLTNGEPWPALSGLSPVGTFWPDQTGPKSGSVLRGGASSAHYLWIEEQMICKQGIKVLIPLGINDKAARTLDQVVHEFAHNMDYLYTPNKSAFGPSPTEPFAQGVQFWFSAPKREIPPPQEALLKSIFTSRAAFSCEGYQP